MLHPGRPERERGGMAGTRIVWNGQLTGIVQNKSDAGAGWYGTPLSQAGIRKLMTSPSQAKTPSQWLDPATINRFSKEVHAVLQRADHIRTQNGLRRIHPPDLLLALA